MYTKYEMVTAVLFDVDGVLCVPPELFSVGYARERGISLGSLTGFFTGPFYQSTLGKADLKDLIREHNHIWEWHDPIDDLLDRWFSAEHVVNEPVIAYTQQLRVNGIKCYTATNQEKYRARYIQDVMFPGLFDGYFASHELGVAKPMPEFFHKILAQLSEQKIISSPHDVAFFDDSSANVAAAEEIGISAYHVQHTHDVISKRLM